MARGRRRGTPGGGWIAALLVAVAAVLVYIGTPLGHRVKSSVGRLLAGQDLAAAPPGSPAPAGVTPASDTLAAPAGRVVESAAHVRDSDGARPANPPGTADQAALRPAAGVGTTWVEWIFRGLSAVGVLLALCALWVASLARQDVSQLAIELQSERLPTSLPVLRIREEVQQQVESELRRHRGLAAIPDLHSRLTDVEERMSRLQAALPNPPRPTGTLAIGGTESGFTVGAGARSGLWGAGGTPLQGEGASEPTRTRPSRCLSAELTEDGVFVLYATEISRPMGEVRVDGSGQAEGSIRADYVFGLNNKRLPLAFELEGAGKGRYETIQPALLDWNESTHSGTVRRKGKLRFVGS